ncbi:hypothetical protein ACTXT7_014463 [Hymenolepis weldensis]
MEEFEVLTEKAPRGYSSPEDTKYAFEEEFRNCPSDLMKKRRSSHSCRQISSEVVGKPPQFIN